MKNTKILFRFIAILMTVVLLLSFAACNPSELAEENAEVREMTEDMIDAIIANDRDTAYALMKNATTEAEFDVFFNGIHPYFKDVESYTLTMIGVKINVVNGVTRYTAVYRMTAGEVQYDITVGTSSDMEGLYGFHITSAGSNDVRFTGTLTTMKGANAAQWVLLVVGLATYAFLIAVLVDCCRQKIKQKWLYILIIVLGSVAMLFTVQSSGVNFNINFLNILSYTALMIYQNPADAVQLRILLPVGAIVYLCLRKRLIAKAQEVPVPPPYDGGMNGGFTYTPAEASVEVPTAESAEGQGDAEVTPEKIPEETPEAPEGNEEG